MTMMIWAKGWSGAVNHRGMVKRSVDAEITVNAGVAKIQIWTRSHSPNRVRPTRRVVALDIDQARIFQGELNQAIELFDKALADSDDS